MAATAEATIAQALPAQTAVAGTPVARASVARASSLPVSSVLTTPLPVMPDNRDGAAGPEGPGRERFGPGGFGDDGLTGLLAEGKVRSGREVGPDNGALPETDLLPVLPALRDLLPHGALARGSVVSAGTWSLLCLALAAGPVASGAWCAVAGIPELGVAAAADAGLDPARLLVVPGLGQNWPQVVISLLDGCDLVVLRPPDRPPAQARRKLEAAVRRHGAVLLVAGDWDGAQVRLRIAAQEWAGVGQGHGRLRWRRAQVVADGRGGWSRSQARWLWLPGPDGTVTAVTGTAVTGTAVAGTAVTGEPMLAPVTRQASAG